MDVARIAQLFYMMYTYSYKWVDKHLFVGIP